MGISIRQLTLLSLVVSSIFISLPYANGGCSGSCSLSGGASYDFLGDSGFNPDMSSFNEFMRDNLDGQSTLNTKSMSQEENSTFNSSNNQTSNENASQNVFAASPADDSPANTTSDNRTIRLGASGTQDKRVSTLAFAAFNGKF